MIAQRRAGGFTLIEMLVAVGIAALLILIGVPSFTTFVRNSEIRSTSESIINGLRAASAEAARQNQRVLFTLAAGSSPSWKFNLVTSPNDCSVAPDPSIQAYPQEEAGRSATATTAPANKRTVCFNGLGRIVKQGDATDHIQHIDITSAVCSEARPLRIWVDDPNTTDPTKPRGLRLCDPNAALAALSPPDPRACRDAIPPPC